MPRAHKPTSRPRAGALTADRPPLVAAPDAPEVTALVDRLRASLAEPATVPDLLAGVPLPVAAAGLAALRQEVGAAAVPLLERAAELEDDALAAAALDQLGTLPDASAAEALLRLAETLPAKERRKAARRGLARLRSLGLSAAAERPAVAAAPASLQPRATLYHALASHIDGAGSRLLWLFADRPLGGAYLFSFILNDVLGIRDFYARDSTRKRLAVREAEARAQEGMTWIELPTAYAQWLVQEAAALNATSGTPLPTEYRLWRDVVGEPPQSFERPLVYEEVSRFEIKMRPDLLRDTPRLFQERELQGWFLSYDEVHKYAEELRRARESRLVLTAESEEQREERIVGQAIRDLFTPAYRHGLQRRLEETGYIFLRTDRPQQAKLAVAAAVELADTDPILLTRHAFVRALVERSIELAIQADRAGIDPRLLEANPYEPMDD